MEVHANLLFDIIVDKNNWWIQNLPKVGQATLQGGGGHQHTILPNPPPQNYLELKEFGPPRGVYPSCTLCKPHENKKGAHIPGTP